MSEVLPSSDAAGVAGAVGRALELLSAGGPVVAILLGLSIVCLSVGFAKLFQFAALRIDDLRGVRDGLALHRRGASERAIQRLNQERNPIARVAAEGLSQARRGDVDPTLVREEIARRAGAEIEGLRSHLRVIEVIATLSPLLGLLGTVLGMISAFQQMESAGSRVDPSVLSGGIWEALLTTAVGLAVAIPSVALLNYLERRVERFTHAMEDAVTQVYTAEAVITWDSGDDAAQFGFAPQPAQ